MTMKASHIGHFFGFLVGSMFSPTWFLLPQVLDPYFNLKLAVTTPQHFLIELYQFYTLLETNAIQLAVELLPSMILVLLLSGLYISFMTKLGGYLATYVMRKYQHITAS